MHAPLSFWFICFFSRRLPNGYSVASETVQLPETLFGGALSLSYCYCVIHGDLQSSKTWEYFSPGYMNEMNSWRKLSIPAKYQNTGIFSKKCVLLIQLDIINMCKKKFYYVAWILWLTHTHTHTHRYRDKLFYGESICGSAAFLLWWNGIGWDVPNEIEQDNELCQWQSFFSNSS